MVQSPSEACSSPASQIAVFCEKEPYWKQPYYNVN